jgi:triosephosphate isomerase
MKYKPLIIANWKMSPNTTKEAVKLFQDVKELARSYKKVETAMCVPPVYMSLFKGETLLGAQDIFYQDSGAFTGEISPTQLGDLGVMYVIVGHSERRTLGETDQDVAKKVVACIKHRLTPIICVGESSRVSDDYSNVVGNQVKQAISSIPVEAVPQVVFAYEPIWAIGADAERPATADEAKEMKLFIRKVLTDIAGVHAQKVRIMYGGSTNPDNTKDFLVQGEADGLLVGGASLDANTFGKMLEIANNL